MNSPADQVKCMSLRARTSFWHLMLAVIQRALISPLMVDIVYHDRLSKATYGSFSKACHGSIRHGSHDGHVAGVQDQMSMEVAHRLQFTHTKVGWITS